MAISFKAIRSDGPMIDAAATEAALRKNMRAYCNFVVKTLQKDYQEIPEGPNYKRRYPRNHNRGVGGGWKVQVSGNGQEGDIYNDVPYAKFVQGHHGQQSQNNVDVGWNSIDDVVAATRQVFNQQMQDAIKVGVAKARQNRNRKGQFA